jgi:hypothetical protein
MGLGIGKDEDMNGAPSSANTSLSCCAAVYYTEYSRGYETI